MYDRSLGCGIVVKKERECQIRTSFQTLCDLYIDTDVVVGVIVIITMCKLHYLLLLVFLSILLMRSHVSGGDDGSR